MHFAWTAETIAKSVNFLLVLFLTVWGWRKYGTPLLAAHQQAQNSALEQAVSARAAGAESLAAAKAAFEGAQADAPGIVAGAREQAAALVAAERLKAQERAARMLAHAKGELERERYRVRQELLGQTVERAYGKAVDLLRREIGKEDQQRLLEEFVHRLEARPGV